MGTLARSSENNSLWLKSRGWDLTWISGSALVLALPYTLYFLGERLGLSQDDARNGVNILVAFLIGGPHMYATHMRSTFDPAFRQRHRSIYLAAIIIPAVVLTLGYYNFVLLLTFFFFWASVHVLHQIVYIVDCYHGRAPRVETTQSKMIDYAVVLTALYPVAMYRFVHGTFTVGPNLLYFPPFLKFDAVWYLSSAIFATALTLFISKTYREFRTGQGNLPKTILIGVTAVATFITPFFHELDVAFQGLNTWHSIQYLGLTWYVSRLRYERGDFPRKISVLLRPGEWWRFYGFNILLNFTTLIPFGILLLTRSQTGLGFDQCYYLVVLCFLLTHYYHDHILFSEQTDLGFAPVRSDVGMQLSPQAQ